MLRRDPLAIVLTGYSSGRMWRVNSGTSPAYWLSGCIVTRGFARLFFWAAGAGRNAPTPWDNAEQERRDLVARSRAPPNIARKPPHHAAPRNSCAPMPRATGFGYQTAPDAPAPSYTHDSWCTYRLSCGIRPRCQRRPELQRCEAYYLYKAPAARSQPKGMPTAQIETPVPRDASSNGTRGLRAGPVQRSRALHNRRRRTAFPLVRDQG